MHSPPSTPGTERADSTPNAVVIVTGRASGLDLTMAATFAEQGTAVAVLDISGEVETVVRSLGDRAIRIHADVSDPNQAAAAVKTVARHFRRLDVLCNNAGIDGPPVPLAALS